MTKKNERPAQAGGKPADGNAGNGNADNATDNRAGTGETPPQPDADGKAGDGNVDNATNSDGNVDSATNSDGNAGNATGGNGAVEAPPAPPAPPPEGGGKEIAVLARHKSPHPSYRIAGLVLRQQAQNFLVTAEQLEKLRRDTWVEVKE